MTKNELMTTTEGYVIPMITDEVMNGVASELEGLQISLDKGKIPAGGGLAFEVPGNDPESPDSVKEITGVIIDHYPLNSYWTEKYNGQNVAPNCYSTDSHNGIGSPGGDCSKCPFNKFGSGEDGQSKACKNAHRLYILRSGEMYPIVITVPPTSLKPLSDYLAKRIVTKGLRLLRCCYKAYIEESYKQHRNRILTASVHSCGKTHSRTDRNHEGVR